MASGSGVNRRKKYVVENILNVRKDSAGNNEYLVKWAGKQRCAKSWVPKKYLNCPRSMRLFEIIRKSNEHNGIKFTGGVGGFERGLTPEKIISVSKVEGHLVHLIKWEGSSMIEMVPAEEGNEKCPDLVIKFYQSRIIWYDREKK